MDAEEQAESADKSVEDTDTATRKTDSKVDPKAQIVIVEGQVITHIGSGQPGVIVSVHREEQDGSKGGIIATGVTDELGDFKLTSTEVVRGDVIVTLSKENFVETVHHLHLADEEFPPFLAEMLEGNLVFSGRVLDSLTKKPVAKASVKLGSSYRSFSAMTDDDGRFTIKGATPGEGELIVEADGYGREQMQVVCSDRATETTVVMKPERIVHIKIVDDGSRPIAGVTVEAYDRPRDDFRTAVTGEDGTVSLHGIHFDADALALRLTQEDYVSPRTFDHDILLPTEKTESTHQATMMRAGRITGRVTDAQSGKPLNGPRVMAGEGESDLSPRDWANYRGEYTISGVPSGEVTITVHLSGYAPALRTLEVTGGETATLDFELRPGATITGLVKNESGEPVGGANVETTRWRGHTTLGLRAITGQDGRFVIDSAPHDELEITAYARYGERVSLTVIANQQKPIEITLPDAPAAPVLKTATAVKVGDQAPAVTVTSLEGKRLELATLKGKTVLLDFWATWCAPCVEELPLLAALYDQGKARKDFVMIGISLDGDEKMLRRFLKKHRMEWHQVFGSKGGAQAAAERFGVVGLPAIILIGPDGKILASDHRGPEIIKVVKKAWEGREAE